MTQQRHQAEVMDELRMKEENPMSEKAKREKMWYEFFKPKGKQNERLQETSASTD